MDWKCAIWFVYPKTEMVKEKKGKYENDHWYHIDVRYILTPCSICLIFEEFIYVLYLIFFHNTKKIIYQLFMAKYYIENKVLKCLWRKNDIYGVSRVKLMM